MLTFFGQIRQFQCHCICRKVHWTRKVPAETRSPKWINIFWFNFVISLNNSKFTQIKENFSLKKLYVIYLTFLKDSRIADCCRYCCLSSERESIFPVRSIRGLDYQLNLSKYFESNTKDSESRYRLADRLLKKLFVLVIHQRTMLPSSYIPKVVHAELRTLRLIRPAA